ncbi:diacylglycerol/lipid kinase family protein [Tunturiibacter gelidiferens]|uniref:diacylglycerol/lipid kinase family protein n=1 Tax=Tunturiibacter gelidiferens TaxID=3069689 RepID=UPI003D9BC4AB
MHRATLIINASAGRSKNLRATVLALVQALEQTGAQANAILTTAAREAQSIAADAAAKGCDTVFACGGDGTVHEVLQGLVGTKTALGVVPLGTANAFARNLGLSLDPLKALQQQLSFESRPIPVGEARYAAEGSEVTRHFIVMAGAGPDGALVYRLLGGKRSKLGRNVYYAHSLRLFLTRSFPAFRVDYRRSDSDQWVERRGVGIICSRVANLGGIFSRLATGSSANESDLLLSIVKPPARIGLPAWFAFSHVRLNTQNPWLEQARVSEFRCSPLEPNHRIHAELDGEWIGQLPMSVRLLPNAISLLIPRNNAAQRSTKQPEGS